MMNERINLLLATTLLILLSGAEVTAKKSSSSDSSKSKKSKTKSTTSIRSSLPTFTFENTSADSSSVSSIFNVGSSNSKSSKSVKSSKSSKGSKKSSGGGCDFEPANEDVIATSADVVTGPGASGAAYFSFAFMNGFEEMEYDLTILDQASVTSAGLFCASPGTEASSPAVSLGFSSGERTFSSSINQAAISAVTCAEDGSVINNVGTFLSSDTAARSHSKISFGNEGFHTEQFQFSPRCLSFSML